MKAKLFLFSLIQILNVSQLTPAFAQGSKGGGGGDMSEIRIDQIRDNLLQWIITGPRNLQFESGMNWNIYAERMTQILQRKKVVFTFTDDPAEVKVIGKDKTCRSGFAPDPGNPADSSKDIPFITCLLSRFSNPALIPEDKNSRDNAYYRMTHHEYAALVLVEKNEGAASDYYLSNQISAQGRYEKVFRLPILSGNVGLECPVYLNKTGLTLDDSRIISQYLTRKGYILSDSVETSFQLQVQTTSDTGRAWEGWAVLFYKDINVGNFHSTDAIRAVPLDMFGVNKKFSNSVALKKVMKALPECANVISKAQWRDSQKSEAPLKLNHVSIYEDPKSLR